MKIYILPLNEIIIWQDFNFNERFNSHKKV